MRAGDTTLPRRFVSDSLRYLPATLTPSLCALAAVAIFTRIFNPATYGVYVLILAVAGPVTDVAMQWIAQPAARFYAEYRVGGRLPDYERALGLLAAAVIVGAIVLGGAAAAVLRLLAPGSVSLIALLGALAYALSKLLMGMATPVLRASLQATAFSLATSVSSILSVAIPWLMIWRLGPNIAWLLWGQAGATVLVLPYIYRRAGLTPWGAFTRWRSIRGLLSESVRRFSRYGTPMMIWFVAASILSVEDRYVIGAFRGAAEVSIYNANYNLMFGLGAMLNTAVTLGAGPLLYLQWGRGDFVATRRSIADFTEIYVLLGLALLGGAIAAGQPFDDVILGPRFRAGLIVLMPVLLGSLFSGASIIGHKSLELSEKTRVIAGSALAAATVNLVLNLASVPFFGYRAAAYSTLVSYALYAGIVWWQAKRFVPWQVDLRMLPRYALPMLVAALTGAVVAGALPAGLYVQRFLAGSAVFLALYAVGLFLTGWRRIRGLYSSAEGTAMVRGDVWALDRGSGR